MVLLHRCFAKVATTVQKQPRNGRKISTKYFMGGGWHLSELRKKRIEGFHGRHQMSIGPRQDEDVQRTGFILSSGSPLREEPEQRDMPENTILPSYGTTTPAVGKANIKLLLILKATTNRGLLKFQLIFDH